MSIDFNAIEDMSILELLSFLDEKRITADRKREEIKKLRSAIESTQSVRTNTFEEVKEDNPKVVSDNDSDDFEKEVEYYLTDFLNLKEYNHDSIEEILPSRTNYNYERIVLSIMAHLTHDIIDIKEIIVSDPNMDVDELKEYKDEMLDLYHKRSALKEVLLTEEKEELFEKKNNLIFIPVSGSDDVRIFDELKAIPKEEYEGFIELFESIKNGTFKNIRRLTNNENYNGALEVKGHQIRVVFQRLSSDCYAIIATFMKKTQNDYGYRNNLSNRYSEFKSMEKELKQKVNDPLFIAKNKKYEEELFELLSNGKNSDKGGCK